MSTYRGRGVDAAPETWPQPTVCPLHYPRPSFEGGFIDASTWFHGPAAILSEAAPSVEDVWGTESTATSSCRPKKSRS